jgi:hypothetical protein
MARKKVLKAKTELPKAISDVKAALEATLIVLEENLEKLEEKEASLAQGWFVEQLVDSDWSSKSLTKLLDKLRESSEKKSDITFIIAYLFMRLVEEGKISMALEVEGVSPDEDDEAPEVELPIRTAWADEDQITFAFEPKKNAAVANGLQVAGAWVRILMVQDGND